VFGFEPVFEWIVDLQDCLVVKADTRLDRTEKPG
jgi:hypothetical protein